MPGRKALPAWFEVLWLTLFPLCRILPKSVSLLALHRVVEKYLQRIVAKNAALPCSDSLRFVLQIDAQPLILRCLEQLQHPDLKNPKQQVERVARYWQHQPQSLVMTGIPNIWILCFLGSPHPRPSQSRRVREVRGKH